MRIDIIPIEEMTESHTEEWLRLQEGNSHLAGPCFHPELFLAVGRRCSGVQVAVLHHGPGRRAYWPFQRDGTGSGARQMRLCDYSAVIGPPLRTWNMNAIMSKAGLREWEFMGIPDAAHIHARWEAVETTEAPRVDLREGLSAYLQSQQSRKAGYKEMLYKRRLIERRLGVIQYIPVCSDIEVLRQMLSWKSERYELPHVWSKESRDLLQDIFHIKKSSFSGVLSALYGGDHLLAASFCLRYQGILHGTAMAFNPDFAKFSGGSVLLFSLISRLEDLGCRILDFGPGAAAYKFNFANTTVPVLRGSVRRPSLKERIKSIGWLYAALRPMASRARSLAELLPHRRPSPRALGATRLDSVGRA